MTSYAIIWISYLVWIPSNMLARGARDAKRGKPDPVEDRGLGFFPIIPVYPMVFSFLTWMLETWQQNAGALTIGLLHLALMTCLCVRGLWCWFVKQRVLQKRRRAAEKYAPKTGKTDVENSHLRNRRMTRI